MSLSGPTKSGKMKTSADGETSQKKKSSESRSRSLPENNVNTAARKRKVSADEEGTRKRQII